MNIAQAEFNAIQKSTVSAQLSENAAKKLSVNWATVLQSETISTSTWTCEETGLTIASQTTSGAVATATISGSIGCYNLINKITTSGSETLEQVIKAEIVDNQGGSLDWVSDYK